MCQRFNVTRNLEKFCKILKTKQAPSCTSLTQWAGQAGNLDLCMHSSFIPLPADPNRDQMAVWITGEPPLLSACPPSISLFNLNKIRKIRRN